MSVKTDLDELIAWYETNKPGVKVIVACCTKNTLRKFAKRPVRGGPFMYRDREIIPTRKPRKERDVAAIHEQASI